MLTKAELGEILQEAGVHAKSYWNVKDHVDALWDAMTGEKTVDRC